MVIPKPLCKCSVCEEARKKGVPYVRTGPSAFLHDEKILIDTPAEIALQLNRSGIDEVDYIIFTHLDPDHVEGFRVVEQITLDFRTWQAHEGSTIKLVLPREIDERLSDITTVYGPVIDFYEERGFIERISFGGEIDLGSVSLTPVQIEGSFPETFVYVFQKQGKKLVYAPCDIKPFPEYREELQAPDLLVIQPGIFENELKHGFVYPEDHISRTTLYTFQETMALAERIGAREILFIHLEEYWNRSHDDYMAIQEKYGNIRFAHDGMRVSV